MKTYTPDELKKILADHRLWWIGDPKGSRANLSRAYLSGAYLSGADLSGAYLSGADLSGAYLSGADGISPARCTPLLMLADQPGKIRAYKLVTADGLSPIHGTRLRYGIGDTPEQPGALTDPNEQCGGGIHVATLDWCLREWRDGWRVMIVEFEAKDIACIPTSTDGKFRLFRCTVVGEKDISELVKKPEPKEA